MTREQKIDLLVKRGITQSHFETVRFNASSLGQGIEIGQGACLAVILRLNRYVFNNTTGTENTIRQIYYGDRTRQECELLRGESSEIIFCNDLSEVFIRCPYDPAGVGNQAFISIMIYSNPFLNETPE